MRRFQILASMFLVVVSATRLVADEASEVSAAGVLAVLDPADSMNRYVLYDVSNGEVVATTRAKIESEANALSRNSVWIPFRKSNFEQELQQFIVSTPTLNGVQLNRTAFEFSDPENVAVILDVTLSRSALEEPLVNAANSILAKLHSSEHDKLNFGAKPGRVQIQVPESIAVLKAINEDLARPELRLAGCSVSKITFVSTEESRSTLLDGTLAFEFQSDGVIAAIQETLGKLGYEDWQEVQPVDKGFEIKPPEMDLFVSELKQALRKSDSTDLLVILCDATLEPSKEAPGQMIVNLNGYISLQEVEVPVVDIANQVATTFFGPYLAREEDDQTINVQPNDLVVRPTSRSASHQFVRLAHRYTEENRLEDAVKAFEMAAFEDRQAMNTMYWLAVAHLRLGNETDARTILRRTVRRNARSMEEARLGRINEYADLMHVLQSVQGSLRQRLHELEGQVYADYCKKTRRHT